MLDRQPAGNSVEVMFVLDERSHAGPVAVAGDFNGWDVTSHLLEPDGQGALCAAVRLPVGQRYEFRYRDAAGRWFNDESADDYCDNELGGMNGVLLT